MTPDPTGGPSALEGLRVIETASFIAGPYCAAQLAEFGATVIKVELPGSGDALRAFGTASEAGESLAYLSECRNKQSVTLDLRRPEGRDLFLRLIADADVWIENFQPGTVERWGIGWDVVSELNPRLVMARISGYGQTGPYRDRPGFGRIANAFGGLSFLAGFPDRPPTTPGSATLPDYLAGLFAAQGVLLALRARDTVTGRGQVIDVGLYEGIFRILDELAPAYDRKGFVRQRMGPGTVNVVPHSHYPTSDGRWIAIACTNDKMFARLADAMGRPDLATPERWARLADRDRDRDDVDRVVGEWTAQHPRARLLELCAEYQVPCGPIYSVDEIFDDAQYAARANISWVEDPRLDRPLPVPAPVPRLVDTPARIEHLGPPLGEHNRSVFVDQLGLSEDELARLVADGVC